MRNIGRGTAWLLVLAFGCGDDGDGGSAPGSDEQSEVTQVQPRESATDKLVAALGGQENLDALMALRTEGSGVRYLPNEGVTPDDAPIQAHTFERVVSVDLGSDALRVDTSRDIEFLFPGSEMYSTTVQGNLGASTQPFFGAPLGALGSDKVASVRRQELLITPHLIWRDASSKTVTEESSVQLDGVEHQRLVVTGGPAPLTLFVNAETGDLSKVETLEHDFYLRDVLLEIYFEDWQPADTLRFPRSRRVVRAGQTLFTEEISAVTVNPTFDADTFAFPEGVVPEFDAALYARGELSHQWYYLLDSIGLPLSGVDLSITPMEVGSPRVTQLAGGSHHSFVVQQEAGLVLVDAPLYEDRGGALVEFLEERYPGVPVQAVVVSHFHEDHTAGIREVLGRTQADLIVHESTESFWRDLLAAPSTLRPDALSESMREVTIRTVPEAGELELADATNPVTLYHLATSHAADMLLTHETAANAVFVVDIYSPGNGAQIGAADLQGAIDAYGIPTDDLTIVGGHGGIGTYAELEAQLP